MCEMVKNRKCDTVRILKSKEDKLQKAIFFENGIEKYYAVAFYVPEENECVICVSSQIGCPEKCRFCATGDQAFVRNLTIEEIKDEIEIGLEMLDDMVEDTSDKRIAVIFEGMGEASYNSDNCFGAYDEMYQFISDKYDKLILRVSSSGNIKLCETYRSYFVKRRDVYGDVEFQVKLSVHTSFNEERKYIMPVVANKYEIENIISHFQELAKEFGTKLICNYVLFEYPNGGNNYSVRHAQRLVEMIDKNYVHVTLGKYSETGKNFKSPEEKQYKLFYYYLMILNDVETDIVTLYGNDINAACGMLNYCE